MDISEHESQQKIVDRAGNRQDSSKYDSQEDEPGAKKVASIFYAKLKCSGQTR